MGRRCCAERIAVGNVRSCARFRRWPPWLPSVRSSLHIRPFHDFARAQAAKARDDVALGAGSRRRAGERCTTACSYTPSRVLMLVSASASTPRARLPARTAWPRLARTRRARAGQRIAFEYDSPRGRHISLSAMQPLRYCAPSVPRKRHVHTGPSHLSWAGPMAPYDRTVIAPTWQGGSYPAVPRLGLYTLLRRGPYSSAGV